MVRNINIKNAQRFAEKNFKRLEELEYKFNFLHSKYVIMALEELGNKKYPFMEQLKALAWIHDIGKIEDKDNHAEIGISILSKEFKLDEISKDCIKNHGSSAKPKTKAGKLFRNCDGLSLFYPEMTLFMFYALGKEGKTYKFIREFYKKLFDKYSNAYADNPRAKALLNKKYSSIFN